MTRDLCHECAMYKVSIHGIFYDSKSVDHMILNHNRKEEMKNEKSKSQINVDA
jgi:hypothetical protein